MKSLILSIMLSFQAFALEHVSVQLNWKYQFEYAGLIMAKEKGFYKVAGFNTTLKEYQTGESIPSKVISGDSDFGISDSLLMGVRADGIGIVLLANYLKSSPYVIVSQPEIIHPLDLNHKRFMASNEKIRSTPIYYMFVHLTIGSSNINYVKNTFKIDDFVDRKIDAMTVYKTNELYYLNKLNIPYNIIDPKNYGFEAPAQNLFTTQKTIDRIGKERIIKFIDATNKGWQYAFSHPDETINIILQKYNGVLKKDRAALEYELRELKKLFLLDEYSIGEIPKKDFYRWFNIMKSHGEVDSEEDFKNFFFGTPWRYSIYSSREQRNIICISILSTVIMLLLVFVWYIRSKENTKDQLTKLNNRVVFFNFLKKEKPNAVFIIDIDGFGTINEVYGIDIGSKVLCRFGIELEKLVYKEHYSVFRLDGDEFAITTKNKLTEEEYTHLATNINNKLNNLKINIDGHYITISITFGYALSERRVYEKANSALVNAKLNNKVSMMYTASIENKEDSTKILEVRNSISYAIKHNKIKPVYQAIVDKDRNILKYEVLVRMEKNDKLISPFFFLDVAIKTKLYSQISSIIINAAINKVKETHKDLSINLTYSDIKEPEMVQMLEEFFLLDETIGRHIIFEITESEDILSYDVIKMFVKKFRKFGVRFAIDDFGSGFSNFEHIFEIQPDYLKIDGSLVKDIDKDENARTLVEAIISFSHKLGITVIAEYIHSEIIFEILIGLGVDQYQGYYFHEPSLELVSDLDEILVESSDI